MGTIVCATCNETIDHFEDEKVTTIYAKGKECHKCLNGKEEE